MSSHPPADAPSPRVLITAGPTAEDIDPVRYITNRSTGRMGLATALATRKAGGTPFLILGPSPINPPPEIPTYRVRSAADMLAAVTAHLSWADALVMAAAVADYTPAEPLERKLKKGDGDLFLRLKRTVDILAAVRAMPERQGKCVVGFALDVGLDLEEGKRKLRDKNLDAIVVNTTESFGSGSERACILSHDDVMDCGEISKECLAEKIVSRILDFFQAQRQ
ncbi:MAG: hypothetical protein LIP77_06955 [Planctomycetes bacterium]|nr:hypothetical protein [Planctomycetota bacterium]